MKLKPFLLALPALFFGSYGVSAQTTAADLEGTWILNNLLLPGAVPLDPIDDRLRIPLQGLPSDAQSGQRNSLMDYEIIRILLSADNTFTGNLLAGSEGEEEEFAGEFVITEDGLLEVVEEVVGGDNAANRFAINEGRSLMVGVGRNTRLSGGAHRNFRVDFDIITRAPESLTHADIAGTWVWQDSFIEDVFGNFQFDPEFNIVISSDGTGVAQTPDEGDIPFSILFGDDGELIADFGDGDRESFYINSTKDVFVRIKREEREGFNPDHVPPQWGTIEVEYEFMSGVAVRQPDSLQLQDMVGTWNVFVLVNDVEWFETDPFTEPGADPNPDFEPFGRLVSSDSEQVRVVVKEPRTETSTSAPVEITVVVPEFNNERARGTRLLGDVRIVDNRPVFTVNVDGRPEPIPFAINASKDFIVRYEADPPPTGNGMLNSDVLVGVKRSEADLGIWERTSGSAPPKLVENSLVRKRLSHGCHLRLGLSSGAWLGVHPWPQPGWILDLLPRLDDRGESRRGFPVDQPGTLPEFPEGQPGCDKWSAYRLQFRQLCQELFPANRRALVLRFCHLFLDRSYSRETRI